MVHGSIWSTIICLYDSCFMSLILVLLCSVSSLTCYILLLIPATILRTPLFAIICFAFGYGPAPLLLVIIVPFLTEHISTALGLHKSLEMAGGTLMQAVHIPVGQSNSSTLVLSSTSKRARPLNVRVKRKRLFQKSISSGSS